MNLVENEILLPVTLNNNQSINQSIKVYYHLCGRIAFAHF